MLVIPDVTKTLELHMQHQSRLLTLCVQHRRCIQCKWGMATRDIPGTDKPFIYCEKCVPDMEAHLVEMEQRRSARLEKLQQRAELNVGSYI
jgi:hypothetical protein